MAQLIDSSVLIAYERSRQIPETLTTLASHGPVAIAAITASELLVGLYRADSPERRLQRERYVNAILSEIPILPFELQAARTHAQLTSLLLASGRLIGANDLLIAATAVANGYAVLTANVRDFRRIPGLTVLELR